jgi:hypothetical protein
MKTDSQTLSVTLSASESWVIAKALVKSMTSETTIAHYKEHGVKTFIKNNKTTMHMAKVFARLTNSTYVDEEVEKFIKLLAEGEA